MADPIVSPPCFDTDRPGRKIMHPLAKTYLPKVAHRRMNGQNEYRGTGVAHFQPHDHDLGNTRVYMDVFQEIM